MSMGLVFNLAVMMLQRKLQSTWCVYLKTDDFLEGYLILGDYIQGHTDSPWMCYLAYWSFDIQEGGLNLMSELFTLTLRDKLSKLYTILSVHTFCAYR